MISLFDLWQKLIGTVNTHQGGHVRPHRNFVEWVNDISFSLFEEEYSVWEKEQVISDRLMPFLRSYNIVVSPESNQMWDVVKLPADYEHFSSARVIRKNGVSCGQLGLPTVSGKDCKPAACPLYLDEDEQELLRQQADAALVECTITKVTNNRWAAICQHKMLHPTANNPKCTQFERGLKLAPKGLGVIVLDYLRLPKKGSFAYTISNPGTEQEYIQYDADNSQPLEWSETLINEFITRLQKKYGVFVREELLYQQ